MNYGYKMAAAVALIPLLYLSRGLIERYLGRIEVDRMRLEAAA